MLSIGGKRAVLWPHQSSPSTWGNCRELGASLSFFLRVFGALSLPVSPLFAKHTLIRLQICWTPLIGPKTGGRVTHPRWSFSSPPQATRSLEGDGQKSCLLFHLFFFLPFF